MAQLGLSSALIFAAVDRGARPRRVRRIHRVEGSLRCRHVVGRLEELHHDRGALVLVVKDLDSFGGNVNRRSLAGLGLIQAPGQVIGIDVGESDDACRRLLLFRLPVGPAPSSVSVVGVAIHRRTPGDIAHLAARRPPWPLPLSSLPLAPPFRPSASEGSRPLQASPPDEVLERARMSNMTRTRFSSTSMKSVGPGPNEIRPARRFPCRFPAGGTVRRPDHRQRRSVAPARPSSPRSPPSRCP